MVKEGIEECGLSKAQGFSQGGCVCFSDSSQAPADRHWKSNWGKKCAGRSDERKRRRRRKKRGGGGIWDSYLIKCCFRGNLEIFLGIVLLCTLQLISSLQHWDTQTARLFGVVRGLGGLRDERMGVGGMETEGPAQKNTRGRKYSFYGRFHTRCARFTHASFSRTEDGRKTQGAGK